MYIFSIFFNMKVCCMFLLESPHRGDSNSYTQYTIFNIKKENHPKLSKICSNGIFTKGLKKRVRNSCGKRVNSVRAIKFYYMRHGCHCF